tara:strand:- start:592 stop:1182 length:591 start_codon:yes stop_codon:yes gene_type:complete
MKYNYKNKKEIIYMLEKIFRNKNSIIISGGNTIKNLLKDYKHKILCKKILLSDERLVKKNSNLRNDKFFKSLIKKKIIKHKQLVNYNYQELDEKKINTFSNKISKLKFDYALLSLGSNGHFASIFKVNNTKKNFYSVKNSPKYPKRRVTLSLDKISKSKKIFFLASRKNKKNEVLNFQKYKLIKKLPKNKTFLYTF